MAHTRRTNYAAHTKAKAPLANMHILRRRRLSCETSHGPGLSTYCGRNMRLTIHKNATSGAENVSNYPHIAGEAYGTQCTRAASVAEDVSNYAHNAPVEVLVYV